MARSVFSAQKYTDRDLIESIVSSFYILDYGYIGRVNGDKTVDVVHAKRLKTVSGQSLPETVTKGVEVLTVATNAFSLNTDYQEGDKVLLLGLKNYVQNVGDVTEATETTAFMHYSRSTLKALPLCVFNADAQVKVEVKDGKMAIACKGFSVTDGNGTAVFEVTP